MGSEEQVPCVISFEKGTFHEPCKDVLSSEHTMPNEHHRADFVANNNSGTSTVVKLMDVCLGLGLTWIRNILVPMK